MEKTEKRDIFFLLAVLFVGANLRAPVTCIGAISDVLSAGLGLSGAAAGLLTTLPLLAFALLAVFAGRIGHVLGLGRALCDSMLAVTLGVLLRSLGGAAALFTGTVIAGVGIGVVNVLVPVVVKAYYPERIGPMTSAYTTSMSIFAGLSSALVVPLSKLPALGWRGALGVWAVPALAAFLLWLPRRQLPMPETGGGSSSVRRVLRSRVAWRCTAYMGAQAFIYYGFVSWMPSILAWRGMDAAAAGALISVYQLMGIPANFLSPLLAARLRDQRVLTGGISVFYLTGMLLLLFGRSEPVLWAAVILCGFSTGCAFSLCMALIGMRTKNASDAAGLSGLLQTAGYGIAAISPLLLGRIFDLTGSWTAPLYCLLAGVLIHALCGQLAGKSGYVEE